MNERQLALIKKDIHGITSNKQVVRVMLIVPLALVLVLPSIIILTTLLVPDTASDFEVLLNMLPVTAGNASKQQLILALILNKIMPAFFLIIPLLGLIIGQFGGVILVNSGLLLGFGMILAVLDVLLMKESARNFTYEALLKL